MPESESWGEQKEKGSNCHFDGSYNTGIAVINGTRNNGHHSPGNRATPRTGVSLRMVWHDYTETREMMRQCTAKLAQAPVMSIVTVRVREHGASALGAAKTSKLGDSAFNQYDILPAEPKTNSDRGTCSYSYISPTAESAPGACCRLVETPGKLPQLITPILNPGKSYLFI